MATNINETESVATATLYGTDQGDVARGCEYVTCSLCQKQFRGTRGLATHERSAHATQYHAKRIPKPGIKPRWSDEEVYRMARYEAELLNLGIPPRRINSELAIRFGNLAVERIKGKRKEARYKSQVQTLCTEMKKAGPPSNGTVGRDDITAGNTSNGEEGDVHPATSQTSVREDVAENEVNAGTLLSDMDPSHSGTNADTETSEPSFPCLRHLFCTRLRPTRYTQASRQLLYTSSVL